MAAAKEARPKRWRSPWNWTWSAADNWAAAVGRPPTPVWVAAASTDEDKRVLAAETASGLAASSLDFPAGKAEASRRWQRRRVGGAAHPVGAEKGAGDWWGEEDRKVVEAEKVGAVGGVGQEEEAVRGEGGWWVWEGKRVGVDEKLVCSSKASYNLSIMGRRAFRRNWVEIPLEVAWCRNHSWVCR